MRNLLIIILLFIVIWWVRRALSQPHRKPGRRGAPASKRVPERMLACAHCGLHVPESEGVQDESGFYCCDDHRRLAAPRQ